MNLDDIIAVNYVPISLSVEEGGETITAGVSGGGAYVSDNEVISNRGRLGGWIIDSSSIRRGSMLLNSQNEQILIGAATAPTTGTGIFLGKDGSDYEFRAGDPTANYIHWDGSTLTVTGVLTPGSGTGIGLMDGSHDLVFSVTDADTVAWAAGTIEVSDGTTYSIGAGNTGNMAALTYVYLDPDTSTTALQTSTTYTDAVGTNKLLLGTAQNQTTTASFIPFFGGGKPLIDGEQLGALSVGTAVIGNAVITNAKVNDMAVSKLTAGTITGQSIVLAASGTGDVEIRSGIAAGDFNNSGANSGFIIGVDDSDSDTAKFYFGGTTRYIEWDGTNLTINGYLQSTQGTFGGDGSDGALSISSGTTNIDASGANFVVKNYTSISITGTATLGLTNPASDGTILILKSQGDVTIENDIDLTGDGGSGGAGASHGAGSDGTNGFSILDDSVTNAGGGGDEGLTPGGGPAGTVGAQLGLRAFYPTPDEGRLYRRFMNVACGSGGGGGGSDPDGVDAGGAGGNGGGALIIECGGALDFDAAGIIYVDGEAGSAAASGTSSSGGGGGGGSAGMALLLYNSLTDNSGTINARGGAGGAGGSSTETGAGRGGGGGGAGAGAYSAAGQAAGAGGNDNATGSTGTNASGAAGAGGGGGNGDVAGSAQAGGSQGSTDSTHYLVAQNTIF